MCICVASRFAMRLVGRRNVLVARHDQRLRNKHLNWKKKKKEKNPSTLESKANPNEVQRVRKDDPRSLSFETTELRLEFTYMNEHHSQSSTAVCIHR